MNEVLGRIGVDTGMLLMVDPAYLFSPEEWVRIGRLAKERGGVREGRDEWHLVILEALSVRHERGLIKELAVVVDTRVGDGRFAVKRTDDGILIEI